MTYLVRWESDIDAETPQEAAKLAHQYQQAPTEATFFEVFEYDNNNHLVNKVEVDLGIQE